MPKEQQRFSLVDGRTEILGDLPQPSSSKLFQLVQESLSTSIRGCEGRVSPHIGQPKVRAYECKVLGQVCQMLTASSRLVGQNVHATLPLRRT